MTIESPSFDNLKIVATGSGTPYGKGSAAIERALDLSGKQNPNVLVIPTPKRTLEAWGETIPNTLAHFKGMGFSTKLLHEFESYDREAMSDRIEEADLIYTSGGDTLYLMETLKSLRLHTLIGAKALEGSVVLSGTSAGAILPMNWGHSDSLSYRPETAPTWDYIRVDGLGLAPFAVTPHYDTENERLGKRADRFQDMLSSPAGEGTNTAIGIDNFASVVIEDGKARSFTPHQGQQVHVLTHEQGSNTFHAQTMTSDDWIDLSKV